MAGEYPSSSCSLFHDRSGALIILLWNFAVSCVFNYIVKAGKTCIQHSLFSTGLTAVALVFVPLAGLVADVYVGRYKVVKYSMRAIWLGLIGHTIMTIPSISSLTSFCIDLIFLPFIVFGMTGFFANIVQLSMDQFHDASSCDIKAFLYLYYWTYCISKLVVTTVCVTSAAAAALMPLLAPVILTIALCSEFLFNYKIIKEPVTNNPLKLIFRVLWYAKKNKHPRQRKAFTYCEDKPYSRIDLGKSKYGGPFTTEQVEDVKTCFRTTIMIIVPSLLYGYFIHGDKQFSSWEALLNNSTNSDLCYKRLTSSNIGEMLLTLLIPLCMITNSISRCICAISILRRCGTGLTLILICLTALLCTQAYHQLGPNKQEAALGHCKFMVSTEIESTPWPMVGYSILTSCGEMLVSVACLEFVCAQSPYSMKGLLLGTFYLSGGVSVGVISTIGFLIKKFNPNHFGLNCNFWFLVTCSAFAVLLYIAFIAASIWYKRRQREDNLPSENYFAEKYYEKLLEHGSDDSVGKARFS